MKTEDGEFYYMKRDSRETTWDKPCEGDDALFEVYGKEHKPTATAADDDADADTNGGDAADAAEGGEAAAAGGGAEEKMEESAQVGAAARDEPRACRRARQGEAGSGSGLGRGRGRAVEAAA